MTTRRQAAQQALEALTIYSDAQCSPKGRNAITALREALAQPEQEPVEVDRATMELAESVGLIGPASRTHDLHSAIQRFHDLICVNATIKAAQMAADAIREATPPAAQPEQEPVAWGVFEGNLHDMFFTQEEAQEMADLKGSHAEVRPLYTIPPAAQPEPTPWRDMVVVSLVREGIDKHRARELADHFAAERNNG